jgi:hypothetical protein
VLLYDKNDPEWGYDLKISVKSAIKEVLESPVSSVLPTFVKVKEAKHPVSVTPTEKAILELRQGYDAIRREIAMLRHRGADRPMIRSEEDALEYMREFISQHMPEDVIIERMSRMGATSNWTRRTLAKMLPGREKKIAPPTATPPHQQDSPSQGSKEK